MQQVAVGGAMRAGLHQGVGLRVVQLMTHAHAQTVAEGTLHDVELI